MRFLGFSLLVHRSVSICGSLLQFSGLTQQQITSNGYTVEHNGRRLDQTKEFEPCQWHYSLPELCFATNGLPIEWSIVLSTPTQIWVSNFATSSTNLPTAEYRTNDANNSIKQKTGWTAWGTEQELLHFGVLKKNNIHILWFLGILVNGSKE